MERSTGEERSNKKQKLEPASESGDSTVQPVKGRIEDTGLIHVFLGESTREHFASPFEAGTSAATVIEELRMSGEGVLKRTTAAKITVTKESGRLPAGNYRFYPSNTGAVRQKGSLQEGNISVGVLMEYESKQLEAELLVDTGCDMDLNISDNKADQLGLPNDGVPRPLVMAQNITGTVTRRGFIKTTLLLEGENEDVIKDPDRFTVLEVLSDVDTCDTEAGGAAAPASPPFSTGGGTLTIKVLSPVRKGKDCKGHDAILGSTGMYRLNLGINQDTNRLYYKHRSYHRGTVATGESACSEGRSLCHDR